MSYELEMYVIGAALVNDDARAVVIEKLDNVWLQNADLKKIHRGILNQEDGGHVVTIETLMDSYEIDWLTNLIESGHSHTTENLIGYINLIKKRYRELIAKKTTSEAFSAMDGINDIDEVISSTTEQLSALVEVDEQSVFTLRQVAKAAVSEIKRREEDEREFFGLETGFKDLDAAMLGLDVGEQTVIAGRPASGKTTLGLNIGLNVAIKSGKKVLFINMEMSEVKLGFRAISALGGVHQNAVKMPKTATQQDWAGISAAVNMLNNDNFLVINAPGASPAKVLQIIKTAHRQLGGLDLVIMDYLQLAKTSDHGNRHAELGSLTKSIRNLSKKLGYHSVLLAQVNRGVEQRPDKRPRPSDVKESGEIEQDCDNFISVYRDEVYNPDTDHKNIAEIIIGKARNGECKTVLLGSQLHYSRFVDLASEYN